MAPSIASEAPQPVPGSDEPEDNTPRLITARTQAEVADAPVMINWPVHWAMEDAAAEYVRERAIELDAAGEPLPGIWVVPDDSVLAPVFGPANDAEPSITATAPGVSAVNPFHRAPPWGLYGSKVPYTCTVSVAGCDGVPTRTVGQAASQRAGPGPSGSPGARRDPDASSSC